MKTAEGRGCSDPSRIPCLIYPALCIDHIRAKGCALTFLVVRSLRFTQDYRTANVHVQYSFSLSSLLSKKSYHLHEIHPSSIVVRGRPTSYDMFPISGTRSKDLKIVLIESFTLQFVNATILNIKKTCKRFYPI